MAKKKKKSWLEQRDNLIKNGQDVQSAKGDYSPSGHALQKVEEERARQINASGNKSTTRNGSAFTTSMDKQTKGIYEKDRYNSYLLNTLSKSGYKVPKSALQSYDGAVKFLSSQGIDASSLMTQKSFIKNTQSTYNQKFDLKSLVTRAEALDPVKTATNVRQSYNDIEAVKRLATNRKDAEQLKKDIEDYRKKYGDNKALNTLQSRADQVLNYINENAKGGSAVSNKVFEQAQAPFSKSPYDTKTQTKQDIEDEYKAVNDYNIEEKYGKPGNLGYEGVGKIKAQTPAEQDWKDEQQTRLNPLRKYQDNKTEIDGLKNGGKMPLGNQNGTDYQEDQDKKEERINKLKEQNNQILATYGHDLLNNKKDNRLSDNEKMQFEGGFSYNSDEKKYKWDIGEQMGVAKFETYLSKKEMVDELVNRGYSKEEANVILDYAKVRSDEEDKSSAYLRGQLRRRTNGEGMNLVEDVVRTIAHPVISPALRAAGVSGEEQHYEQLGREAEKERYYENDDIGKAVYNFGETVGTIAGSSLYGGAGAVPFVTKATEDSYYNALDKGASEEDATQYAMTTGLTTGLIYGIGLKGFNKIMKASMGGNTGIVNGLAKEIVEGKATSSLGKAILKNTAKSAFKEGATFAGLTTATQVADTINQVVSLGKNSDFQKMVDNYMNEGMSEDDAWKQTVLDISKRIGQGAAESFASGTIMGAGGALIGGVRQAKSYNEMRDRADTLRGEYEKFTADTTSPYFDNVTNRADLETQFKQRAKELHPDVAQGSEEAFERLVSDRNRIEGILSGQLSGEARTAIDNWENFVNEARDILGLDRVLTTREREQFEEDYGNTRTKLLEVRNNLETKKPKNKAEAEDIEIVINNIDEEVARVDNAVDSTVDIVVPEEDIIEVEPGVDWGDRIGRTRRNAELKSEVAKPEAQLDDYSDTAAVGKSVDGKDIYIDKIKSGNVSFVDSDGNKVTDYEIDNSPQAELMELGIDKDFNTDTTKAMIKGFEGSITDNVEQYADNFELFNAVGKDKQIKNFNDALMKAPVLRESLNVIGTDAAGKAFSEGRKAIKEVKGPALAKMPHGTFTNDTGKSGAVYDFAEGFAAFTGADVVATEHPEKFIDADIEPDSIRGVYVGNEGKIIFDTKYTSFLRAINHEAGHLTDDFALDEAEIVADKCMDFARDVLGVKGSDRAIKNLMETYEANGQDISYSEAQNEFIKNMVGTAMASEEGVDKLINEIYNDESISEEKKKSIIGKFIDWVKSLIARLKEYGKQGGAYENTEFVLDEVNKAQREEIIDAQIDALKTTRSILEQMRDSLENDKVSASISDGNKETETVEIDGVKYSITPKQKELAAEYKNAVTENDMDKAAELVKEYAASKGFDTKVYHGTQSFGFTQIDLSKSDDKKTFWATNSDKTAQTYSGEYGSRNIGKDIKKELTPEEIIDIYKKFNELNDKGEYYYLNNDDFNGRKKLLDIAIKSFISQLNDFSVPELQKDINKYKESLIEELNKIIKYDSFNSFNNNNLKLLREYLEKIEDINEGVSSYTWDFEKDMPRSGVHGVDKNQFSQLKLMLNELENPTNNYFTHYDNSYGLGDLISEIPNSRVEYAIRKYNASGNYKLYANIDNFMTVDAKGKNWNNIKYEFRNKRLSNDELVKKAQETEYYDNVEYLPEEDNYKLSFNNKQKIVDREFLERVLYGGQPFVEKVQKNVKTRTIANDAIKKGYDGVLIKNVIDNGGRGSYSYGGKDDVYIFFNPTEQVKSADPVTYDDNGEVVPLEKRFDKSYNDIRFSLSKNTNEKPISETDEEIEKDTIQKALKDANAELVKGFAELKGKRLEENKIKKISVDLRNMFNIDLTNQTIKQQLDLINNAIAKSGGDITTANVNDVANKVIKNLLRYSKGEILPENEEILKDIKKTKIKLSDKLKAGITDYGAWYRKNLRNMTISQSGIPIDSIWNEWVEKYPQYFSPSVNEGDMPYELEGIVNTLREGIPFDNRPEAMESYKTEILHQFANELEVKNKGFDKAFNRLARLVERDYEKRIREAINTQSEFHDIEIAEMKYKDKQRQKEMRERRETTRVRQQNVKKLEKMKRAFTNPTIKNRVPEVLKNTLGTFLNAVDAGEMNRLDYYQKRISNLQQRLQMTTGEEYQEVKRQLELVKDRKSQLETAFIEFADSYEKSRQTLETQGEFSEPLMDSLKELKGVLGFSDSALVSMNNSIKDFGGRSIMELNLEEQKLLSNVLNMLNVEINNYNKIIDNSIIGKDGKAHHISELVIEADDEVKPRESDKKFIGKLLNAKTSFVTKNLRPDVVFNKIGGNHKNNIWLQSVETLKDGTRDSMRVQQKAYNELADILEKKEAKDVQKYDEKHLYSTGLLNDKGQEIKVPMGMILQLKMHLNNPKNRAHFIGGGLTIPNFDKYYKGKGGLDSKQQIFNGVDTQVRSIDKDIAKELNKDAPDFEQIQKWDREVGRLLKDGEEVAKRVEQALDKVITDWGKDYIKKHYKVFDGIIKEGLNDVTQKRFGVDLAREDKYTRLISDKDYFTKMNEGGYGIEANLENTGFMKQRTGARNPIILEDALNADVDQIKKSADYIGFLIPQHNFNRLIKYTTVKKDASGKDVLGKDGKPVRVNLTKTLRRNYPEAVRYIDDLKMDLFGGKPAVNNGFLSTIQSGVAIQGLVNNPRVELMQLASYPFAAVELGFKPIAKALVKGGKKGRPISRADRELIDSKTPLMWYRESQKGAMSEIATAKNDKVAFGKIYNKIVNTKGGAMLFGRIEKMDLAAVGRTWYAAEYKARQDKSLNVGSDEYYERVVDLFNKSTEKTQPNYVPITRNYYQRSNNPIFKYLEMFKTVLNQMNNEVYDAQATYRAYKEDYENGGAYGTTEKDVKEAFHKRNRAVIAYVLSHAMVMAIRIIVTGTILHKAWDDVTDEDGNFSGSRTAKYIFDTLLSDIASGFVMGNEIADSFNALTDKAAGFTDKFHPDFSLSPIQIISDGLDNIKNAGDLLDPDKRLKRIKAIANSLSTFFGVPYRNTENFAKGIYGMIEDIVDNGKYDYSNDLEDKQALRRYILGDISKEQCEKVIKIDDASKAKFSNAVKNLYSEGKIKSEEAISKMYDTGLWDSDTRKQPTDSYIQGKIEWWDIENKYKDEYISTLSDKGAETAESRKVIAKIAKMPYENAFWENPDVKTTWKSYKSSYDKLLNKVKKWHKE